MECVLHVASLIFLSILYCQPHQVQEAVCDQHVEAAGATEAFPLHRQQQADQ